MMARNKSSRYISNKFMLNSKILALLNVKRFCGFFVRLYVILAEAETYGPLRIAFAVSARKNVIWEQCKQREKVELTGTTWQLPGILLMALGMVWAQDSAYSTGTFPLIVKCFPTKCQWRGGRIAILGVTTFVQVCAQIMFKYPILDRIRESIEGHIYSLSGVVRSEWSFQEK